MAARTTQETDMADTAQTPQGWQPISTAPKDGTLILFVAEGNVYAGCYSDQFAPFPWVFVDDWRESLSGCCDHEFEGRVYTNGYPLNMPTHWMPLPAPPESHA